MNIKVLTLFPGMFSPIRDESILGRAREKGVLDIDIINIRDFSEDKHKKVDDYPFGGGAGMVMGVDPIFRALEHIGGENQRRIFMSPRGKKLDQNFVLELGKEEEIIILCGHYEGVDERVLSYWNMEEVSVGDYILTGGELPAMILVDAVARMIPEVIGNHKSHEEESICSGLLEYPQYTKPREYREMKVPEVLISGNHRLIHLWKFEKSIKLTAEKRPDLFKKYIRSKPQLDKDEMKILQKYR